MSSRLTRWLSTRNTQLRSRGRLSRPLWLESLEDRVVPAHLQFLSYTYNLSFSGNRSSSPNWRS
jgi:hypothetical protein